MKNILLSVLVLFLALPSAFGQFNWMPLDGPEGAGHGSLCSNDNYMFFTSTYYLFRTSDGVNWEKLPNGPKDIVDIQGDKLLGLFPTTKISFDNGNQWQSINIPANCYPWGTILTNEGIFAHNGTQIFHTSDYGTTWDTFSDLPFPYLHKIASSENHLYVSNGKIWRGDTQGNNWVDISPLPNKSFHNIYTNENDIFCTSKNKLWTSHDAGATWSSAVTAVGDNRVIDHIHNNIIYSAILLSQSSDFGETWTPIPSSIEMPYCYHITTFNGLVYANTFNKGIFKYNNATSQLEPTDGITAGKVYDMRWRNGKLWVASGKNFSSYTPSSNSWDTYTTPQPVDYYNFVEVGDGLLATNSAVPYYFWLSTDNGITWDSIDQTAWNETSVDIVDNLIFKNDLSWNPNVYAKRSVDGGQTWEAMDSLDIFGHIFKHKNYLLSYLTTLKKSIDQGHSWTFVSNEPQLYVSDLHSTNDKLFGFFGTQLKISNDDGLTWSYASDGLPNTFTCSQPDFSNVHFYNGNYYIYNEGAGFFGSKDNCTTWVPLGHDLHLKTEFVDSLVYIGGQGGTAKAHLPEILGGQFQGKVFSDKNANNIYDAGDDILQNFKVGASPINFSWFPLYFVNTNENGDYMLGVNSNIDDTVRVISNNPYIESIAPDYYLASNSGNDKDFAVSLTPNITDLSVYGYALTPRPGYDLPITMSFKNKGTILTDAIVTVTLDPKVTYLSAIPTPTQISGQVLTWNISEMPIFSSDHFSIKTKLAETAIVGDVVTTSFEITPPNTDTQPNDNQYLSTETIVSSFDPNDKQVLPEGGLTEEEIINGDELFYTIQFQNTGTYLAEKVRITDMLDTAFNYSSLHFVAASHNPTSFQLRPNGLLEIVFDQINLADSTTNEADSHGFVTYAIQRNKAYQIQDLIENTAAIYFDYNEPIFTNTVTFSVREDLVQTTNISHQKASKLIITPNPTNDVFFISANGQIKDDATLSILDLNGKTYLKQTIKNPTNPIQLSVSSFPKGVYFIQLSDKTRVMVGKVIIQ